MTKQTPAKTAAPAAPSKPKDADQEKTVFSDWAAI